MRCLSRTLLLGSSLWAFATEAEPLRMDHDLVEKLRTCPSSSEEWIEIQPSLTIFLSSDLATTELSNATGSSSTRGRTLNNRLWLLGQCLPELQEMMKKEEELANCYGHLTELMTHFQETIAQSDSLTKDKLAFEAEHEAFTRIPDFLQNKDYFQALLRGRHREAKSILERVIADRKKEENEEITHSTALATIDAVGDANKAGGAKERYLIYRKSEQEAGTLHQWISTNIRGDQSSVIATLVPKDGSKARSYYRDWLSDGLDHGGLTVEIRGSTVDAFQRASDLSFHENPQFKMTPTEKDCLNCHASGGAITFDRGALVPEDKEAIEAINRAIKAMPTSWAPGLKSINDVPLLSLDALNKKDFEDFLRAGQTTFDEHTLMASAQNIHEAATSCYECHANGDLEQNYVFPSSDVLDFKLVQNATMPNQSMSQNERKALRDFFRTAYLSVHEDGHFKAGALYKALKRQDQCHKRKKQEPTRSRRHRRRN